MIENIVMKRSLMMKPLDHHKEVVIIVLDQTKKRKLQERKIEINLVVEAVILVAEMGIVRRDIAPEINIVVKGRVIEIGKVTEIDKVVEIGKVTEIGEVTEINRVIEIGEVTEIDRVIEIGKVREVDKVTETGIVEREIVATIEIDLTVETGVAAGNNTEIEKNIVLSAPQGGAEANLLQKIKELY